MTRQKKDNEDVSHANKIDMNKDWSQLGLKEDIENKSSFVIWIL